MGVRGEGPHQLGEEVVPGRPLGHLVDVVENQAHVERSELSERVEHLLERFAALAGPPEGDEHGMGEVFCVAIAGLAGHPRVDAPRVDTVGPNGLGEERGLSEASPSDDRRQRHREALSDLLEQAGARQLVVQGGRRRWCSAPAPWQGLVSHRRATLRLGALAAPRYCRTLRRRRTSSGRGSRPTRWAQTVAQVLPKHQTPGAVTGPWSSSTVVRCGA